MTSSNLLMLRETTIRLDMGKDIAPLIRSTVNKCHTRMKRTKNELRDIGRFVTRIERDRMGCWGGADGMQIGLKGIFSHYNTGYYNEYSSIARDPIIGSFTSKNWEDYIRCVTVHEFAHVAQRRFMRLGYNLQPRVLRNRTQNGHGKAWQYIYRILRLELVNPFLPEDCVVGWFPKPKPTFKFIYDTEVNDDDNSKAA